MKYPEEQKTKFINEICERISKGESLRSVLRDENMPSASNFFEWIDSKQEYQKQYARATELRAEYLFDEIDEIANHTSEDHTPFTGGNVVQRDKLRIDAIKWKLSKMMPKKYGDQIKVEHDGSLQITVKPPQLNAD